MDGGGLEVTLEAELSIHDDAVSRKKTKKRRRPKGPGAESLLPECRIMALTSLPLTQVVDEDSGRQHYVAAGCSDGPIRCVCVCTRGRACMRVLNPSCIAHQALHIQ